MIIIKLMNQYFLNSTVEVFKAYYISAEALWFVTSLDLVGVDGYFTLDEPAFVENLVFYYSLNSTYRIKYVYSRSDDVTR